LRRLAAVDQQLNRQDTGGNQTSASTGQHPLNGNKARRFLYPPKQQDAPLEQKTRESAAVAKSTSTRRDNDVDAWEPTSSMGLFDSGFFEAAGPTSQTRSKNRRQTAPASADVDDSFGDFLESRQIQNAANKELARKFSRVEQAYQH